MTNIHASPTTDEDWLFDHADQRDQPRVVNPITRYLCGATYVNARFADQVIKELTEDGHRAVTPSIGYDIEPVIRHAYRARRIWLAQHVLLTFLLVSGLVLAPVGTFLLLSVALLLVVPSLVTARDKASRWKMVGMIVLAFVVLNCVAGPLLGLFMALNAEDYTGSWSDPTVTPDEGMSAGSRYALEATVMAVVTFAVVTMCRAVQLRVLTTELSAGSEHSAPVVTGSLTTHRLATVAAAQHGNVVLHSGYNPFLGAGQVEDAWSVAIELKAAPYVEGMVRQRSAPETSVAIDPVELNRYVKHRLAALRSPDLPERERMDGLSLRDQVIASGTRWRNFPLVDERLRLPYSVASRRAIEEIIRHPQSSARHFLRASVGAESKMISRSDGTTIMPAEHQSIVVTTFSHIAVEGGLLYVETITAVLGPIRQEFLDIDQYPAGESMAGPAFVETLTSFGPTVLLAPVRLAQTIVQRISAARRSTKAERSSTQDPVYDFGATAEVRQLASSRQPVTYLQRLDASKYAKLMQRRINEAIIDFLRASGIDTSEYETRVNVFTNNGVMIGGDNYGAAAGGDGARADGSPNGTAKAKEPSR
jgi:hypothetical protein